MIKKIILRAIAVTLALPILITAPHRASASDTVLDDAEWNAFVEEKIELDDQSGLAVTLVNGSEVSFKNWGYANMEEQSLVTEDTVFVSLHAQKHLPHCLYFCCRKRASYPLRTAYPTIFRGGTSLGTDSLRIRRYGSFSIIAQVFRIQI